MKILMSLFLFILAIGIVSANELTTDVNQQLIIKTSCSGLNPVAEIMVYDSNNELIIPRENMIQLSSQDFMISTSFANVGTYTAYEECTFADGFHSQQTTNIIVTPPTNLILSSSLTGYNYEADMFYNIFFKSNPRLEKTILFKTATDSVTIQPKELSLIAPDRKTQKIDVKDHIIGSPVDNTFTYTGIYGTGLDLEYLVNKAYVKEQLVFQDATSLPIPHDLKLPITISLNSKLTSTSNHFIVDGKEWNMMSEISTSNIVLIKDDLGNTIYQLQIPVAFDSNGEKVIGTYTLRKEKMDHGIVYINVAVKMPYAWFQDSARVFPIKLDPTIDTPDGTSVFNGATPTFDVSNWANANIPVNQEYTINEMLFQGTTLIADAECETDIIQDATGIKVVDFRSFYNNQGLMQFTWTPTETGTYTVSQYCWRGMTLDLNKIYDNSTIVVI